MKLQDVALRSIYRYMHRQALSWGMFAFSACQAIQLQYCTNIVDKYSVFCKYIVPHVLYAVDVCIISSVVKCLAISAGRAHWQSTTDIQPAQLCKSSHHAFGNV